MRQLALAATLSILVSGCASIHSATEGGLAGGLLGAGVGAAAVAIGGGTIATGALVGAGVGAAAGAYIGCRNSGKCR